MRANVHIPGVGAVSRELPRRQIRVNGLARWLVGCGLIVAVWIATAASARAATFTPEMYGAVGDGVTNDRVAVAAAFEAVRAAGGGRIEFNAGRTYYLGELATVQAAAIEVLKLKDATVEGNGAELVVKTTANVITAVLQLTGPQNVRLNDLRFRDIGSDWSVNWRGAAAVDLVGSDVESGKVMFDRCSGEKVLYLMACRSEKTARIRGISLRDCSVTNSYYGINCRNNGYGLRVTGFRADNVRRPYFVYGVEDHDVELSIQHDGVAPGSSAACIISHLGVRDTRAIRLKARFFGNTSKYLSGLDVEHQNPNAVGGLISGIDATIDVYEPSAMIPVRFRSYRVTDAGTYVEEANTANRITDIRLSGNLATTGPESIAFGLLARQGVTTVTPNGVDGRLFLDASLLRPQSRHPHYPSFAVSTAPGREMRTLKGNLSTQFLAIPLVALDNQPIEIMVTVWVQDDTTQPATAKRTYIQDLLFLQNPGDGNVSLKSKTSLARTYTNGFVTVVYTPVGEELRISLAGYTGVNGLCRCEVEYLSRGP